MCFYISIGLLHKNWSFFSGSCGNQVDWTLPGIVLYPAPLPAAILLQAWKMDLGAICIFPGTNLQIRRSNLIAGKSQLGRRWMFVDRCLTGVTSWMSHLGLSVEPLRLRRVSDNVGDARFKELTKNQLDVITAFLHWKTFPSVYSNLKWLALVSKFWKHDWQTYTIYVLVNNCLHITGQTVFRKVHIGSPQCKIADKLCLRLCMPLSLTWRRKHSTWVPRPSLTVSDCPIKCQEICR